MASISAPKDFSPVEDAERIKNACLGLGTDEKTLISILANRNSFQRKLIRAAYEEIYHEDLISQLRAELSGQFERAMCHWVLEPAERDAVLAHLALEKSAPDYKVIVEISCTRSPEDLLASKRAYRFRYKHSLEEDVASHSTGDIRKLLVALASAYRYDGPEVDENLINMDVEILHQDIYLKAFNHEELVRILSTRSKTQLNATFNQFRDKYHQSVTKGLKGSGDDEYSSMLRTAIRCIKNPDKYFVKVLKNSIQNGDKETLSRIIVTRAEKDLKVINEVYSKRHTHPLDVALAGVTSGDHGSFLRALLTTQN